MRSDWLRGVFAWEYVNMVVASTCFAFLALITQARIWKSFQVQKLDKFTLFTHSFVGWNLENRCEESVSIFFRLSWDFKREKSVMQTLDFVSGLHNCLEFSQPLLCLYQAMQPRKMFSIA